MRGEMPAAHVHVVRIERSGQQRPFLAKRPRSRPQLPNVCRPRTTNSPDHGERGWSKRLVSEQLVRAADQTEQRATLSICGVALPYRARGFCENRPSGLAYSLAISMRIKRCASNSVIKDHDQ
jgi:hypothetical protein